MNSETLHFPKQAELAATSKLPELALVEPASGEAAALPSSALGPFAVPCLQLASPRAPMSGQAFGVQAEHPNDHAPRACRTSAGAHGRLCQRSTGALQTPNPLPRKPHNSPQQARFPSTQRAWAATVTHRSAASARALRRRRPRISKKMHPAVPSRPCSRDESAWQAGRVRSHSYCQNCLFFETS